MTMATIGDWQSLLRAFKEKLAQRLWALPTVTETEKEMVFKEYLQDLAAFEISMAEYQENLATVAKRSGDESELLRSLLGVSEDEMRGRALTAEMEVKAKTDELAAKEEELKELRRRTDEAEQENEHLRKRLFDFQKKSDDVRVEQIKIREDDIKYFGETHEALKNELKDLEGRLLNLKGLFAQSNKELVTQKQEEISMLQKKLLDEMEAALRRKQELHWGEEELFAKGIANRVRTALVSAQGQLFLTLERLGVLEPETHSEAFWKTRLKFLVEGAAELRENFKQVQTMLLNVTNTLDDYLHLTHRATLRKEPIGMKEVVQREIADIYTDRQPTLSLEFMAEDPLPFIQGDPSLVQFIVGTLLRNAREALPNDVGNITISLKNQPDKKSVRLYVHDGGGGFPEHLKTRAFQPFFSTKPHRQGLSLSRARRYAELHGGTLELVQTSPDGTLFQLDLPIQQAT